MVELDVSDEFIEENKERQTMPKKGGRYTKQERVKRQDEIHRLHFDHNYSARKIAELMKVNRNTVNSDISYWYSKIGKNHNIFNPEAAICVSLERFQVQRLRLRIQIEKTQSFQERLTLERLILDIDSRIMHTYQKLSDSAIRISSFTSKCLNDWMKDHNKPERVMSPLSKITVSEKALKRIDEIIKEDRKQVNVV